MPDAVARLNLVDRAGAVLELAVGLGSDAVKVLLESPRALSSIWTSKPEITGFQAGFPGSKIASLAVRGLSASLRSSVGRGKRTKTPLLWFAASKMRNCKRSVKSPNSLRGVEEKTESPVAVAHHLAVDVQHAARPATGRRGASS